MWAGHSAETVGEAAENLISRHRPLQMPVQEEIKAALHVTGLMISAYVEKKMPLATPLGLQASTTLCFQRLEVDNTSYIYTEREAKTCCTYIGTVWPQAGYESIFSMATVAAALLVCIASAVQ